jgi:hypothetical protein
VFFKNFGRISTHNFVQIKKITPNYAYYKIVQLTLRYECPTTLISYQTSVRYIRNRCLTKLFKIFNIFCRRTIHNFMKINIITHNYAY